MKTSFKKFLKEDKTEKTSVALENLKRALKSHGYKWSEERDQEASPNTVYLNLNHHRGFAFNIDRTENWIYWHFFSMNRNGKRSNVKDGNGAFSATVLNHLSNIITRV